MQSSNIPLASTSPSLTMSKPESIIVVKRKKYENSNGNRVIKNSSSISSYRNGSTISSSNHTLNGASDSIRIIILLTCPVKKEFEFIYLRCSVSSTLIRDMIELIPFHSNDGNLRDKEYVGFYRPFMKCDMINSISLKAHGVRHDEILVAVPRGIKGRKCAKAAKPILNNEKIIQRVTSYDDTLTVTNSTSKQHRTRPMPRSLVMKCKEQLQLAALSSNSVDWSDAFTFRGSPSSRSMTKQVLAALFAFLLIGAVVTTVMYGDWLTLSDVTMTNMTSCPWTLEKRVDDSLLRPTTQQQPPPVETMPLPLLSSTTPANEVISSKEIIDESSKNKNHMPSCLMDRRTLLTRMLHSLHRTHHDGDAGSTTDNSIKITQELGKEAPNMMKTCHRKINNQRDTLARICPIKIKINNATKQHANTTTMLTSLAPSEDTVKTNQELKKEAPNMMKTCHRKINNQRDTLARICPIKIKITNTTKQCTTTDDVNVSNVSTVVMNNNDTESDIDDEGFFSTEEVQFWKMHYFNVFLLVSFAASLCALRTHDSTGPTEQKLSRRRSSRNSVTDRRTQLLLQSQAKESIRHRSSKAVSFSEEFSYCSDGNHQTASIGDVSIIERINKFQNLNNVKLEGFVKKYVTELVKSFPDATVAECYRFLLAMKNVKPASKSLETYLRWRRKNRMNDIATTYDYNSRASFRLNYEADEKDWNKASIKAQNNVLRLSRSLSSSSSKRLSSTMSAGNSSTSSRSSSLKTRRSSSIHHSTSFHNDKNDEYNSIKPLPHLVRIYDDPAVRTNDDRKILQFLAARIDLKLAKPDVYALAIAYYIDAKISRFSIEKLAVLIDVRGGKGWANPAPINIIPFIKLITRLLSTYYPERMAVTFLFPVPKTGLMIWAIVKKFLDPNTVKKVQLMDGPSTGFPKEMDKFISVAVLKTLGKWRISQFDA